MAINSHDVVVIAKKWQKCGNKIASLNRECQDVGNIMLNVSEDRMA